MIERPRSSIEALKVRLRGRDISKFLISGMQSHFLSSVASVMSEIFDSFSRAEDLANVPLLILIFYCHLKILDFTFFFLPSTLHSVRLSNAFWSESVKGIFKVSL